jgi:modified peptide precursor CbpA
MAKGSGDPSCVQWVWDGPLEPFFFVPRGVTRRSPASGWPDRVAVRGGQAGVRTMPNKAPKPVIATRRGCKANGTGLSHFILMEKKAKKA